MTAWTLDDLRRLDLKYAEEGVHVHQRPFRAAMELLGSNFVMGVGGNPEVKQIMGAYAAMVPEVNTSWPGAGIGFAASVDQIRKLTFEPPRVFRRRWLWRGRLPLPGQRLFSTAAEERERSMSGSRLRG